MPLPDKRYKESMLLTFPRKMPHTSAAEYLYSKNLLQNIQFRQCQWDKAGHDPHFHLIAVQRKLDEKEKILKSKREWAKKEYLKVDAQWKDLEEKELKFKETFKNMSGFVTSNVEKRRRAENRMKESQALVKLRSPEVEQLQRKINLVVESRKEMEAEIEAMMMYELYLHKVADINSEFKNAHEIISRYESLISTKIVLGNRQDEHLSLLETARAKTVRMVEDYSFKILGLNNRVADLNSRYNTAFREALHWERIVLDIKSYSFQKFQELVQVKQSCLNIYLLMCKRKGEVPKIGENDFNGQLVYIKRTLGELEMVKALARKVSMDDLKKKEEELKRKNERK